MTDLAQGGEFLLKAAQDGGFILYFTAKDFDGAGALLGTVEFGHDASEAAAGE